MIKLISLDLDGTLLDPSGQITPASKSAIAKARQAGLRVVINTGRPLVEAAWFVQEAGCDSLVSALGGALLGDASTGQVLRRWDLPDSSAWQALNLCLGREIELMIFAGEEILVDPFSKASLERTFPYEIFHRHAKTVDDPLAYMQAHGLPLTKLHGDRNPDRYPLQELSILPGAALTSSSPSDFELVAHGVDKGRCLALLSMIYGIPLEQCAAVGDSENDLAALQAVGLPIAMGNAGSSLKTAARRIVADNGHDGAAQAILSCLS